MMLFTIALVFFIINLLINLKWRKSTLIIKLSILAIVISFSSFALIKHSKENTMWFSLIPNIVVGADIDNHNLWKNQYKYPSLPFNELGNQVDGSTYERTAWFFAGFRLLKENPLGYGLVKHSFGSLALLKWPDFYNRAGSDKGSTHSAWLDLALGVGLPGIFFIWLSIFIAWYRSLFQSGIWFSYVSWTAPLLFFSYLTTEANGQHFIEQLFFMSAFFCGITFHPQKNHRGLKLTI
jgi:multisubunit Na+/H+ antiporter MnhG subunit